MCLNDSLVGSLLTLIDKKVGEILSYARRIGSVWNIFAGLPFVEILLRMKLYAVERICRMFQRGNERLAQ